MTGSSEHGLRIAGAHPSLPGHFPGAPVVPGVVLLSLVLDELKRQHPGLAVCGIRKLKFLRMVLPEDVFTVDFAAPAGAELRFKGWRDGERIFEGHFALRTACRIGESH